MRPSFSPYLSWWILFWVIVLDVWLVISWEKYFRQREVPNDLRIRLRYLKAEIAAGVKKYLRKPTWLATISEKQPWRSSFVSLVLILALAAFPSLLVIRSDWFYNPVRVPFTRWFETRISLPGYMLLGIFCLVVVGFLITRRKTMQAEIFATPFSASAARKEVEAWQHWLGAILLGLSLVGLGLIVVNSLIEGHIPGWNMVFVLPIYLLGWVCWDSSFGNVRRMIASQGGVIVAMLLAHIGLVLVLYNTYGRLERFLGFDLLTAAALINLLRYSRKIPPIYWLVSLSLVLFTWNIDVWWFSVIGDEYNFYTYGREIAQQHSLTFIGEHLFNGQAVYTTHPYFSSVIQAIFMRVFGVHNFGWRFSNPYLCALAVGFFFLFLRAFLRERVALLAAAFLAGSHYLMTFGKIGYNNLQALFILGMAFWAATRAIQTQRLSSFAVLGAVLGCCFYVYPAALYVIPLPLFLLLLYAPPRSRSLAWRLLVMGCTLLVLLFPLFMQPGYWQTKISGTFLNNPELTTAATPFISHFITNLIYAFLSFLYTPNETHFVVSAYMDPVSGALIVIGLAALIRPARNRFQWFLWFSFLFMLVSVGASHDRTFPPTTRMFLLVPWFAMFAAIGLEWVNEQLLENRQPARSININLFFVVVIMLAANIYMAYNLTLSRTERYQGLEELYLRIAQRAAKWPEPLTTVFICGESWGVDGLRVYHDLYGVPASTDQIVRVVVKDNTLPADALLLLESPSTLAIFGYGLEDDWRNPLEAELTVLGKRSCDIKTGRGASRFKLWYNGHLDFLCQ